MYEAYLLLGSNEGNRFDNITGAGMLIASVAGEIVQKSALYETQAWGFKEQADFLNRAIKIETPLEAENLLRVLKQVETEMGRRVNMKWGPRLIDIDILLFSEDVIDLDDLKIPHPAIQDRRFTLIPLAEIAGDLVHPVLGKSIGVLLEECTDESKVTRVVPPSQ